VRGLAHELRRRGHVVDVIAPADSPLAARSVHSVGRSFPIRDNGSVVPVALGPLAPIRVAHLLRERSYDVVHVHEPMIPAVSLTAVMTSGYPLVATFHRYASRPGWYRVFAPLCRAAIGRLDVRIAVSQTARRHVSRTSPGDYRIIPNGIETQRYARLPSQRSGTRILFIGRADRRKGLPALLDAFARLPPGPELHLVGVVREDLSEASGERVFAYGVVSDGERDSLLARADVLCVPSLEGESFGIVVLEGMAAGVPVVASALAGYAELLPPAAGRLVPPGDAEALAEALQELLADPVLRERMGAAGRDAARRYDWRIVADEVLASYSAALSRHARRQAVLLRIKSQPLARRSRSAPGRTPPREAGRGRRPSSRGGGRSRAAPRSPRGR
jgi:phosphatidylinositol alpha-mannosyltransferase